MKSFFSRDTPAAGAGTLRRVAVADLREGMFVQKFVGSWINHPFWRSAFTIDDAQTLAAIRASSVTEVWIDTLRSTGAPEPPAGPAPLLPADAAPDAEEDSAFGDHDGDGDGGGDAAEADRAVAPGALPAAAGPRRRDPAAEFDTARRICVDGRDAVAAMFHDVRMGRAIQSAAAVALVEDIAASVERHPEALVGIARLKSGDDYTYLHSVAVCALMVSLAQRLGFDTEQTREAGLGGLLHDLGKAQMPQAILAKPGRLTDEEFAVMRGHPASGWRQLRDFGAAPDTVLDVVLHHHEKFDGSGYPHRLKGEGISLLARMGAVCDVYDAVTSDRPYKRGWDPALSVRRMNTWAGHFDPAVLQAFFKSVGIYPAGSLVRLRSGRLAVVMGKGTGSLLAPRVRVFYSTLASEPIVREVVDLSAPGCRDRIVALEDAAEWSFKDLDRLWLP